MVLALRGAGDANPQHFDLRALGLKFEPPFGGLDFRWDWSLGPGQQLDLRISFSSFVDLGMELRDISPCERWD